MALTNKQRAFIDEYFHDWNATQAAIRAGYSEKTAYSSGQRLLKHVEIAAEIERRISERSMSADEVLQRLGDQARGTVADFVDVAGRLAIINLEKAEEAGKLHLIKKLKYNAQGTPEIELYDAQAALQLLGRHYGLFTDKVEHSGEVDVTVNWDDGADDND